MGLEAKIETFLGEFRLIVPALGAIFGFQLVVGFQPSFSEVPSSAKLANFGGLVATALAIVFLIVPASYHRFTQRIDASEGFVTFAQRMVSLAFVFLPISLCASLYVQAVRTFGHEGLALGVSLALAAVCGVFWWAVPMRRAGRLNQDNQDK